MQQLATAIRHHTHNGVHFQHIYYGSNVEMRGSDGSYSHWNLDHWLTVKRELNKKSVVHDVPVDTGHVLLGKSLLEVASGKLYKVEKVVKHWWRGNFLVAVMNHNGSHRSCVVDNVSCCDPSVLKQANAFGAEFVVQA